MAIPTPALKPEPGRSRLSILLRILLGALLVMLVAVLALGFCLSRATKAALPQLDGNVAVAGLSGPVSVVRDVHGVPHIKASTLPDLFFAQGYITAQDRLWQMDMS